MRQLHHLAGQVRCLARRGDGDPSGDSSYGELIDDIDRLLARHPPAKKDRKIGRADFSVVFAPLFARPSSNEGLKVELAGRCVNQLPLLQTLHAQAAA